MYNGRTGEFEADQIGSFIGFRKVSDEYGVSLYGTARIPKRKKAVYETIKALFEEGKLSFSFEISAASVKIENGVRIVDADENNKLTAMAIVSIPAYDEAMALSLAAETKEDNMVDNMADNTEDAYVHAVLAEASIETIRDRAHMQIQNVFHEAGHMDYVHVLLFCLDCAIAYAPSEGKTYKFDYVVRDDEVAVTDFYEVAFERKGEKEMNIEETMVKAEEEVEVKEVIEEVSAETETVDTETVEVEASETPTAETETAETHIRTITEVEEKITTTEIVDEYIPDEPKGQPPMAENQEAPVASESEMIAQLTKECEELKAQVEELKAYKDELESLKAEAIENEKARKKEELITFAKDNKLDVSAENIKKMIDEMDYASIISEVRNKIEQPKHQTTGVFADIKVNSNGRYGDMLTRV